jgi:hypothetical protein
VIGDVEKMDTSTALPKNSSSETWKNFITLHSRRYPSYSLPGDPQKLVKMNIQEHLKDKGGIRWRISQIIFVVQSQ